MAAERERDGHRLLLLPPRRRRRPMRGKTEADEVGVLLRLLRDPAAPPRPRGEALGRLADACVEEAARRQVARLGAIPLLVSILETATTPIVLNRAARALGNLALDSENVDVIHATGAPSHLVRLLSTATDPACLHSVCRTCRLLCRSPSQRASLCSLSLPGALCRLLSARTEPPLLVTALRSTAALLHACPASLAPALSSLGLVGALGALASHPSLRVRHAALHCFLPLCSHPSLRPALGAVGAVALLAHALRARPPPPAAPAYLRALCLLCREAVNRAKVREAGGLEILVGALREGGREGEGVGEREVEREGEGKIEGEEREIEDRERETDKGEERERKGEREMDRERKREGEEREMEEERDREREIEGEREMEREMETEKGEEREIEGEEKGERETKTRERQMEGEREREIRDREREGREKGEERERGIAGEEREGEREMKKREREMEGEREMDREMEDIEREGREREREMEGEREIGDREREERERKTEGEREREVGAERERGEREGQRERELGRTIVCALLCFCYDSRALERMATLGLVPLLLGRLGRGRGGAAAAAAARDGGRQAAAAMPEEAASMSEEEGEAMADSFDFPAEWGARAEADGQAEGSGSFLSLRSWLISEGLIDHPADVSVSPSPSLSPSLPPCPLRAGEDGGGWRSRGHSEAPSLLLLSRYSQCETPPSALCTGRGVGSLLALLSPGRAGASRAFRILSRLTLNPYCLEPLVRAHAPSLVRETLARGGGGVAAASGSGAQLRELGEILLRNMSAQAESAFGIGTLSHMLHSSIEIDRTACAIAIPHLCRSPSLRRRLLVDLRGLPPLLRSLLSPGDEAECCRAADAVCALCAGWEPSLSAPGPGAEPSLLERTPAVEVDSDGDDCPYRRAVRHSQTDVSLLLDCGLVLPARRRSLTSASPVMAAMLGGAFLEAALPVVPLRELGPAEGALLLHHLHGCLPQTCPRLRPDPPLPGQPLALSPLGAALEVAGRFLTEGLADGLGRRALALLPAARLPELWELAQRIGDRWLRDSALRLLLSSQTPEPAAWSKMADIGRRGEGGGEGLLVALENLVRGQLS